MNKQEVKDALARIQQEASDKVAVLKKSIGDQDGDGDVDLSDVRIRVEQKTGHIGPRELAFALAGALFGFVVSVVMKLIVG